MHKERVKANLADLVLNEGQVEWLPSNPRQWTRTDIDKLKKSLQRDEDFQEDRPALAMRCEDKLLVFAGNLRTTAAKELKWKTLDTIIYTPESEEDKEAIIRRTILDNASFGEWDIHALSADWSDLPLSDWGVKAVWDEVTLEETPQAEKTEVVEDDFDEETDKVETRCKRGDIWQLGDHRLMCGDSTSLQDVETLMGGERADITFTSPPYNAEENLGGNTHMRDSRYMEKDDNAEYGKLLHDYLDNSLKVSKYSIMNIQMLANNKKDVIQCLHDFKDHYVDEIIWNKGHGAPHIAENVLSSSFEHMFIFSPNFNPSRAITSGEKFRGVKNVYDGPPQRHNEYSGVHAATFPIHLPAFAIEMFTKDSVLDLFGGTGTTMMAAEQLGRKSYLMELDPRYCDVIIARWEKLTGRQAQKVN